MAVLLAILGPLQRGSWDGRGSAQLQVPMAKLRPAPGLLASSTSSASLRGASLTPETSQERDIFGPALCCCHQAPCTAFQPGSTLLHIFSSLHVNKFPWRQWSLNIPPCSWAALCWGSLKLLSTGVPTRPGCSWVPRCTAATWK